MDSAPSGGREVQASGASPRAKPQPIATPPLVTFYTRALHLLSLAPGFYRALDPPPPPAQPFARDVRDASLDGSASWVGGACQVLLLLPSHTRTTEQRTTHHTPHHHHHRRSENARRHPRFSTTLSTREERLSTPASALPSCTHNTTRPHSEHALQHCERTTRRWTRSRRGRHLAGPIRQASCPVRATRTCPCGSSASPAARRLTQPTSQRRLLAAGTEAPSHRIRHLRRSRAGYRLRVSSTRSPFQQYKHHNHSHDAVPTTLLPLLLHLRLPPAGPLPADHATAK